MHASDGKNSIYNPFYGKIPVTIFMNKIQSLLKKELRYMPISDIDKIIKDLSIFRIKYSKLAETYQEYYLKITKLWEKNSLLINLPTDLLYLSVVLLIGCLLFDVFTVGILVGSSYIAKGVWGYIDRT